MSTPTPLSHNEDIRTFVRFHTEHEQTDIGLFSSRLITHVNSDMTKQIQELLSAMLFMYLTDHRVVSFTLKDFLEYIWTRNSSDILHNRMLQSDRSWVRDIANSFDTLKPQEAKKLLLATIDAIQGVL